MKVEYFLGLKCRVNSNLRIRLSNAGVLIGFLVLAGLTGCSSQESGAPRIIFDDSLNQLSGLKQSTTRRMRTVASTHNLSMIFWVFKCSGKTNLTSLIDAKAANFFSSLSKDSLNRSIMIAYCPDHRLITPRYSSSIAATAARNGLTFGLILVKIQKQALRDPNRSIANLLSTIRKRFIEPSWWLAYPNSVADIVISVVQHEATFEDDIWQTNLRVGNVARILFASSGVISFIPIIAVFFALAWLINLVIKTTLKLAIQLISNKQKLVAIPLAIAATGLVFFLWRLPVIGIIHALGSGRLEDQIRITEVIGPSSSALIEGMYAFAAALETPSLWIVLIAVAFMTITGAYMQYGVTFIMYGTLKKMMGEKVDPQNYENEVWEHYSSNFHQALVKSYGWYLLFGFLSPLVLVYIIFERIFDTYRAYHSLRRGRRQLAKIN